MLVADDRVPFRYEPRRLVRSTTQTEAAAANRPLGLQSESPFGTNEFILTLGTPNSNVVTVAESGLIPPDAGGDVGPSQYLVAVNGRIKTIDKLSGAADGVLNTTLDAFLASVRNGSPAIGPSVRFDRRSGRWFVTATANVLPGRLLLAFSDSGVISTGTVWTFTAWTDTHTGTGGSACVVDSPTLGIDEDALYVGGNQFCGTSLATVAFHSTSAYVIPKAALISGMGTVSTFDDLATAAASGPFSPQGVTNFDVGTNEGYFIGVDTTSLGRLVLRRVSDPAGMPSISGNILISTPATTTPINVPHPGGLLPLDGLDDRLGQAVIRNGRLWTTHHNEVDTSGNSVAAGGRNGVRWYELENLASVPVIRQAGTIFDNAPVNAASYWTGAAAVSGQGHVIVGMSVAGATTRINTAVAGRLAGDPPGSMNGAPAVYSNNTSFTYNLQGAPNTVQQWSTYSSSSLDPADDMTMWTLQEYADGDNSFAMRLVRIVAPPPAQVTTLSPGTVTTGRPNVVVTVSGTSSAGSGFFDPGPGFANHLGVSITGGVVITGVVVTSPTSLRLTLDTTSAALGSQSITVTNPDGQTTFLAGALTVQANVAPVATNDAYTLPTGLPGAPAPGVLGNDSDANNDVLTAQLEAGPSHGTLALNADGGFTYLPVTGYAGPDSFTYRAFDGLLASNIASVSLTIVLNAPPTITAPSPQSLVDPGSGASTGALAFTVTDPEGSPVTVSATSSNQSVIATSGIVLGGSGNSRTVTVSSVAGSAGGSSTITLTASDGLLSTSATFAVSVVPQRGRPQNLASIVARNLVQLAWTNPPFSAESPTGYLIEAGASSGTTFISLPLGITTAFSTNAPSGVYFVRVRTVTTTGLSLPSNEIMLATGNAAPPLNPQALLATVQGNAASFQWTENPLGPEIAAYRLEAGSASGLANLAVVPLTATTRGFAATAPSGTYYVRVRAGNASGFGAASNEAVVNLGPAVCTIPAAPTGLAVTRTGNSVAIRWDPASSGAIPTGYRLDAGRSSGASDVGSFPLPAVTSITASAPAGNYFIRLVTVNPCGASAPSSEVSFVIP